MEVRHFAFIVIFIVSLFSEITYVKADMIETVSSFILFVLFTIIVFAGIGWWSRRQEKS